MRTTNKNQNRLVCVSADFISSAQVWVGLLMSNVLFRRPGTRGIINEKSVVSRVHSWIISLRIIWSFNCVSLRKREMSSFVILDCYKISALSSESFHYRNVLCLSQWVGKLEIDLM